LRRAIIEFAADYGALIDRALQLEE
jgi:hypothetical protein